MKKRFEVRYKLPDCRLWRVATVEAPTASKAERIVRLLAPPTAEILDVRVL